MEKVVHVLLGSGDETAASLSPVLLGECAGALHALGGRRVQVNVVDPSLGPPFGVPPSPDVPLLGASVSAWVDSATAMPLGDLLPDPGDGGRWWGYVVCEAEPLKNTHHPAADDGRVPGFAQMVLLRRPASLQWTQWRERWQEGHTSVALETQSTFRYVQNVVLRPLERGAPAYDAIVEECFPLEAASDLGVFFDGSGDDERLTRNMKAMSESCDRFMDGATPTAWTAQYHVPDP